jgi:hypothetical protein
MDYGHVPVRNFRIINCLNMKNIFFKSNSSLIIARIDWLNFLTTSQSFLKQKVSEFYSFPIRL